MLKSIFQVGLGLLLCTQLAHAQRTRYDGGAQDPINKKTYASDIGIMEVYIDAKGVVQGAGEVPANSDFDLVVNVENHSDYPSTGYRIRPTMDGKILDQQNQGSIRGKEKKAHRWHCKADKSGEHNVQVTLTLVGTPTGGAAEDNPSNNSGSLSFKVGGGAEGGVKGMPDLVIDGINPSSLRAMDKTIVEVMVGNKGDKDVPGPVEVLLEVGGRKVTIKTTTGVPAGKTAFASYELLTAMYEKNRKCTATVDPGNRIKEGDESNNQSH